MVNDLKVEELLIQANPVLDPEELRLTDSEVDARCASILERRGAMQTQTPIEERQVQPGEPRRWRKPALAFIISLLVILVAAGGVALLTGGDPEIADEPVVTSSTTTTSTTTVPAAEPDGVITAPAYAEIPSFSAVVDYYEHDPALGDAGWQATVAVKHAGDLRYEVEVLEETEEHLGVSGTVYFGDGVQHWLSEPDGPFALGIGPFGHLFFDSQAPSPRWDEICGTTPTEIGLATVAGRTTTHVACSSDLEDYELWIDEETGIVMKLAGTLGVGDFLPKLDRDGGFEFTELTLGPVTTPGTPDITDYEASYPPFHMVHESATDTVETWYRDNFTGRQTVVASAEQFQVDSYYLMASGFVGGCSNEGCEQVALEETSGEDFTAFIQLMPVALAEESCAELAGGTMAGRAARQFACSGVDFDYPGYWRVVEAEGASNELWFDTETGLLVKDSTPAIGWEATLLETNPAFPERIFEWPETPPVEEEPGIGPGDIAPLWSGPLLGGGEFDLADYRGGHVVVYNWLVGYGSSQLDGLDLMQRMYEKYGESITFVTVHEDSASETSRVLERRGNTVPAVHCITADGTDHDPACATPELGADWSASPWFLWGNNVPSTTVLDESGTVLVVHTGAVQYELELDALLARIAADAP
jgi:hypothetical protein